MLSGLPEDFSGAIAIVVHIQRDWVSWLAEVLERKTPLRIRQAQGGETLAAGTVLVAPPDRHLVVYPGGTAGLTDAPAERFSRPSGDVLFESIAEHYGAYGIAVVLTGYDGDGARGLHLVREAGGGTIAQNEASSFQFAKPQAAIQTGDVEQILDVDDIGAALGRLVIP